MKPSIQAPGRVGPAPLVVILMTTAFLAYGAFALSSWPAVPRALAESGLGPLEYAALGGAGVAFLLSLWLFRQAGRRRPGMVGRGRLRLFAVMVPPLLLGAGGAVGILIHGAVTSIVEGRAFAYTFVEARYVLPDIFTPLWWGAIGLGASAGVFFLAASIGCWFLLGPKLRRALWLVTDVLLLGGFVYAVWKLPIDVAESELSQLKLPILRLTITALFCVRVAVRIVPVLVAFLQRSGFRFMIAARHLHSQKSGFLTTIGSLSILAVAVSTAMLISVLSVMGGFRDDLKQKILGSHAHAVVSRGPHQTFEGWGPILDTVRGTSGVVAATPYLQGEVMATSATGREGVILRGIVPDSVGDVTDLEANLTSGSLDYLREPEGLLDLPPEERRAIFPAELRSPFAVDDLLPEEDEDESNDEGAETPTTDSQLLRELEDIIELPEHAQDDVRALRRAMEEDERAGRATAAAEVTEEVLPGIVIGKELARSLRLFVGDELDIISPFGALGPAGPMPKSRRFRVAGIFYSGMYEYDMKHAYVLLEGAQQFLNKGQAITGIEIKVDDIENAADVASAIRGRLADNRAALQVQDWQELNRNLFAALGSEKLIMFFTLGIAILIAGFCVFGTLTLMVQEKGREVGILKAMGTTARGVVGIFLFEGLLIGLYGALSGLGIGYLVVFVLEHFGIPIDPEVYYIDRLPVHRDPTEFVVVGIAAVIVCLVATVYPALFASRLRPVEALRRF